VCFPKASVPSFSGPPHTVLMSSIVRVYSATAAPLSSPRPSTTQEDHRRLCRPFSLANAPGPRPARQSTARNGPVAVQQKYRASRKGRARQSRGYNRYSRRCSIIGMFPGSMEMSDSHRLNPYRRRSATCVAFPSMQRQSHQCGMAELGFLTARAQAADLA
jgi:hypothetical protein